MSYAPYLMDKIPLQDNGADDAMYTLLSNKFYRPANATPINQPCTVHYSNHANYVKTAQFSPESSLKILRKLLDDDDDDDNLFMYRISTFNSAILTRKFPKNITKVPR